MRDSMTRDELVAFLVDFSNRHEADAGETLQFLFQLADELGTTEPERLARAARSLAEVIRARNDASHVETAQYWQLLKPWSVTARSNIGKASVFLMLLNDLHESVAMRHDVAVAGPRGFGIGRGLMRATADFDDPLPADVQDLFEN